jgi:uridine kinase
MLSPKRKLSFDQLIKWIHKSSQANELCIIGIDGGGGSGKSTFAQRISEEIPSSQIVAMDHFYLTGEDSLFDHDAIGGNFDWQLLRDEVLLPLREGAQGSYKTRDWEDTGVREHVVVKPRGLVIVEGIYSIRKELEEFFDQKIWVECSAETRLNRGVKRDGESMRRTWVEDWMPREEKYMSSHHPADRCDLIISGETWPEKAVWCHNREKILV